MGMKADIKRELHAKGIRQIRRDNGQIVKLQNAKTAELIRALAQAK